MSSSRQGRERRGLERRRRDRRVDDIDPSSFGPETQAIDSRFAMAPGSQADDGAFSRIVRVHAMARAAFGAGFLLAMGLAGLLGGRVEQVAVLVTVGYALQAWVMWLLPRSADETRAQARGDTRRYALATIGVDLVAFSLLYLLAAGTSLNSAALLVFPVLMAGVLMPRLPALATASLATLVVLLGSWAGAGSDSDLTLRMAQAGLAGMGFFVIVVLAGELAARLAREEQSARGSLELARQQAQLNRLVIQEMVDGVLVVDRGLRVRAANPAARALLVPQGMAPHAPFSLDARGSWHPLAQAVSQAFEAGSWPGDGSEVAVAFDDGHMRQLRMRVRFTRQALATPEAPDAGEAYCVLLLEDVRTAQARMRQERLAAMGRVSAGIAHEIRNPLAAISQANALMLEDTLTAGQHRLAGIVAANVHRLKRIVDDVTELAPGESAASEVSPCDAGLVVAQTIAEWTQAPGADTDTDAGNRIRVELGESRLPVQFDAEHLRRVVVNLLDNALRHGSREPGSVFVRLAPTDANHVSLQVFSDGPVIDIAVERHLFEPFFSTRSRGSGLGLYICRELCERYGARIEYRPRLGADRLRNEFSVTLLRVGSTPETAEIVPDLIL